MAIWVLRRYQLFVLRDLLFARVWAFGNYFSLNCVISLGRSRPGSLCEISVLGSIVALLA